MQKKDNGPALQATTSMRQGSIEMSNTRHSSVFSGKIPCLQGAKQLTCQTESTTQVWNRCENNQRKDSLEAVPLKQSSVFLGHPFLLDTLDMMFCILSIWKYCTTSFCGRRMLLSQRIRFIKIPPFMFPVIEDCAFLHSPEFSSKCS